ncbi:MAG: calcium-binding protein [Pseudomonadota bacterium]
MSHPDQSMIDDFLTQSLGLADAIDGGILDPSSPTFNPTGALAAVGAFNAMFGTTVVGNFNEAGEAPGRDILEAPSGQDFNVLIGLGGQDILTGKRGADSLAGGDGADILFGRGGDDFLGGGNGADILRGGRGDDILSGGKGGDDLRGGAGEDLLLGGNGADVLRGGRGDDILEGGNGSDVLRGGKGMDILEGGAGDDILIGGKDADTFAFDPSQNIGDDLIRDFEVGVDVVQLNADDVVAATAFLQENGITGDALRMLATSGNEADVTTIVGALEAAPDWSLGDNNGDLVVNHPGGTIELDGVTSEFGFADLITAGAVEIV